MREHLYKAKRKDNGEWICGSLITQTKGKNSAELRSAWIVDYDIEVEIIPETICEFTGLTDKKGNKIFEGHILSHRSNSFPYITSFDEGRFKIEDKWGNVVKTTQEAVSWFEMEIIGNIYDNPELLEERK